MAHNDASRAQAHMDTTGHTVESTADPVGWNCSECPWYHYVGGDTAVSDEANPKADPAAESDSR